MKKPDKNNPKEEKKAKDLKTTNAKDIGKKTDKKEETKTSTGIQRTITKKTGTEARINIHKKEEDTSKHTYLY